MIADFHLLSAIGYLLLQNEFQTSFRTMAKSGESGNARIRDLIFLAICGLVAIAIYFVWQALGLSNSHAKPGHELEPTESLNDH
jgi:hypothetical protein